MPNLENLIRTSKRILATGLLTLTAIGCSTAESEKETECYQDYECPPLHSCIEHSCQPTDKKPTSKSPDLPESCAEFDKCDGLDNNCDGITDELGCGEIYFCESAGGDGGEVNVFSLQDFSTRNVLTIPDEDKYDHLCFNIKISPKPGPEFLKFMVLIPGEKEYDLEIYDQNGEFQTITKDVTAAWFSTRYVYYVKEDYWLFEASIWRVSSNYTSTGSGWKQSFGEKKEFGFYPLSIEYGAHVFRNEDLDDNLGDSINNIILGRSEEHNHWEIYLAGERGLKRLTQFRYDYDPWSYNIGEPIPWKNRIYFINDLADGTKDGEADMYSINLQGEDLTKEEFPERFSIHHPFIFNDDKVLISHKVYDRERKKFFPLPKEVNGIVLKWDYVRPNDD